MDKVFYNQSSASKLGWEPVWFGVQYNDEDLVDAVKKWQRKNGLTADGLVGPMTHRRIWTERQANISDYTPSVYSRGGDSCRAQNYIVHNGNFLPIKWDKVVLWDEQGGLKSNKGTYYDYSGKEERKPKLFVNHWDVCLSSESCAKVLNKRGISVHFCIDNDGTIYQLLDTQHGAWHAGQGRANRESVGVEISNAYYTKYQDWYEDRGFGARPLMENVKCHGKNMKPFLGFYDVQLQALQALWLAVHEGLHIPLQIADSDRVDSDVVNGRFSGFVNHYNLTRNKIDCAGLDMDAVLKQVKDSIED